MLAGSLKYMVQTQIPVYAGIPHVDSSVVFFFQELISQMLQVNVEARCTAGEILSHPWVSVSTHVLREGTSVSSVTIGVHAEPCLQVPRQMNGLFSLMSK